jgi:hypothetical protein
VDLLLEAAQLLMADTTAPDPGAAATARLAARGAAALEGLQCHLQQIQQHQYHLLQKQGQKQKQQLRQGRVTGVRVRLKLFHQQDKWSHRWRNLQVLQGQV